MTSRPHKIVVNDRMLRAAKTGVGHYTAQLLAWLPRVAPDLDPVPFHARHIARRQAGIATDRTAPGEPARTRSSRLPWTLRHLLHVGYGLAFRAIARRHGYQLYHEPNHVPIPCRLPTVTTIHDLSVIDHPEWHPADRRAWYATYFERGLRQSARLITVSRFTRDACVGRLNVPADRIDVIPLAPREVFTAGPAPDEVREDLRRSLHLPDRFLLFVGTIEPRKNLLTLLEAYARLDAKTRSHHPLVIVGMQGWGDEALETQARQLGIEHTVHLAGYLTDDRLAPLYQMAHALVFPSLYEGFGLPPLEAMACGCPVVASTAASLPEVVGDAALTGEPTDPAQLAEAIGRLIDDQDLRADLIAKGRRRAAEFSWQRTAEAHADVYRRVLGQT